MTDGLLGIAEDWLAGLTEEAFGPGARDAIPVALGWATVELDRAAIEVASLLPGRPTFEAAGRDGLLGARCRIGRPAGTIPWLLLEPSTEGRLAAFLVRHGEGLAAAWLASLPSPVPLSGSGPTALGPARLVLDRPPDAPMLLVLEPAPASGRLTPGTIDG